MKLRSVLVVCIGNICRSPMAEALLAARLGPGVAVVSAGLGALTGQGADPHAVALMAERGVDITAHRARQLSPQLVAAHELILVMTQRQKERLEREFPSARGRVFRFCHWQDLDVADPYQLDRRAFEDALARIDLGVAAWTARLQPVSVSPA